MWWVRVGRVYRRSWVIVGANGAIHQSQTESSLFGFSIHDFRIFEIIKSFVPTNLNVQTLQKTHFFNLPLLDIRFWGVFCDETFNFDFSQTVIFCFTQLLLGRKKASFTVEKAHFTCYQWQMYKYSSRDCMVLWCIKVTVSLSPQPWQGGWHTRDVSPLWMFKDSKKDVQL